VAFGGLCFRGGFQPPETHDHQQWTAVYVGSLAARMTLTRDAGGWNQRHTGCSRKDTMAPYFWSRSMSQERKDVSKFPITHDVPFACGEIAVNAEVLEPKMIKWDII